MNDERMLGALLVMILGFLSMLFIAVFESGEKKLIQDEAIRLGYAEFVVSKTNNHATEFKWKESK